MHTHPMSHLGFGGHLLHGAPDVGTLMAAGQLYSSEGALFNDKPNCNPGPVRAATVAQALGSCKATHGGFNADGNKCGDDVRRIVLDQFENGKHTNKPHSVDHPDGYPTFARWPKHDDILHQQMWIDWIKRAHAGGMRVMVGLAVTSLTFNNGIKGNTPRDDKPTGNDQVKEMIAMAERHSDFMQVAYSAGELRRIVEQDKLALIVGVELDDLGSFMASGRGAPTAEAVRAEIDRLYTMGVRYAFPVHVTDNYFGGTAVYENDFAIANRVQFGNFWSLACATPADGITLKISKDVMSAFKGMLSGIGTDGQPTPNCASGHVNTRGLQPLGEIAISHMISKGMLIDVDHMSQRTLQDVLARWPSYPFVSGHNGPRLSGAGVSENSRPDAFYRDMAARGGIAGVGMGESTARDFANNVRRVANTSVAVAIGSDINGLVKMPGPPQPASGATITYDEATFPAPRMGEKVWDYNRDGVAHIGLFPDFLRSIERRGQSDVVDLLFNAAEGVAQTWRTAEDVRATLAGRWVPMPGAAKDVAIAANDTPWVIGTDPVAGGFGIHRLGGTKWSAIDGGAVRIAAAPDGAPWVINDRGQIFRRANDAWQLMPGSAKDIGIGADGTVWMIGTEATGGGFRIHRFTNNNWTAVDGGAVAIAVGADGQPWVVNDGGQIFHREQGAWRLMSGLARDIGVGPDGSVWIVSTEAVPGGFKIFRRSQQTWTEVDGGAVRVSVGGRGRAWVINDAGQIFRRQ